MGLKHWIVAGALAVSLIPGAALAQTGKAQTLADMRQDLTVLFVETKRLKRELSTTGGSGVSLSGGSAIDRATAIEGELQRLTGKIEELEFRIDAIVRDATARIADLEFRLVELEGGDVSKLKQTTTLGGAAGAPKAPVTPVRPAAQASELTAGSAELAIGEKADFDAAQAALTKGDTTGAAEGFARFIENYPGSPLEAQARIGRGAALEQGGDNREAARAFLEAYSGNPAGPDAPKALFMLGRSLGKLGKTAEACVTLGEVGLRHPNTQAAGNAQAEMSRLSCS